MYEPVEATVKVFLCMLLAFLIIIDPDKVMLGATLYLVGRAISETTETTVVGPVKK